MWRGLFYSSIGSIGTIGTNGMSGQSIGILLVKCVSLLGLRPKTNFVGEIRAYFNTCRMLEASEVSYLVILLYTVIVANSK